MDSLGNPNSAKSVKKKKLIVKAKQNANNTITTIEPTNSIIGATNLNNVAMNLEKNDQKQYQLGGAKQLIKTLGTQNKKTLLEFYNSENGTNFKSITQVKKNEGVSELTADEYYTQLAEIYNTNLIQQRIKQKQEDKQIFYTADVTLEEIISKDIKTSISYDPPQVKFRTIKFTNISKRKDIDRDIRNEYEREDSNIIVNVMSYNITEHRKGTNHYKQYIRDVKKSPMKEGRMILKPDWLRYCNDISETAYVETDNKCVYYQLTNYLLNPYHKRPTKFIDGERTSEESLFNYFKKQAEDIGGEEYENFNMKSGVTIELIDCLCKHIKRNLYVLDGNNKFIYAVNTNDVNRLYSPIAFYKICGHMFLLEGDKVLREVAKRNQNAKLDFETIRDDDSTKGTNEEKSETKPQFKPILNILPKDFKIENAMELRTNINFTDEDIQRLFLKFVKVFKVIPRWKTSNKFINRFQFTNNYNEIIHICKNQFNHFDNETITNLYQNTEKNNITYINEGIGIYVKKLLNLKQNQTINELKENNDDEYFDINITDNYEYSSNFNSIIKKSYDNGLMDFIQFIRKLHREETIYVPNGYVLEKIDVNKMRRNIVLTNSFKYCVYSVLDEIEPFKTEHLDNKVGLYFVETKNDFPLQKTRWYLYPIVKYALNNKLISEKDIKFYIKPTRALESNYFVDDVKYLLEKNSNDNALQKLAVNSFIGLLGRKNEQLERLHYTLDIYEAGEKLANENCNIRNHYNLDSDTFENVDIDNDIIREKPNILYEVLEHKQYQKQTTTYLIYKHILEIEAIELHKLYKKICDANCVPLELNTDAILYLKPKNIKVEINEIWYDDVLKYKFEKPNPLKCDHKRYESDFDFNEFRTKIESKPYNIKKDTGDFDEMINDVLDSKKSTLLLGSAGVGKTTFINKVFDRLNADKIKFIALSPTNKARNLLKCENKKTLDKFYITFKKNKSHLNHLLERLKYIFVDEVSMMKMKFYNFLLNIKRAYPSIIFIITGDFKQLEPVCDIWSGDYKNSNALKELCDYNLLELTTYRRGDLELKKVLDNPTNINLSYFEFTEITYKNLAYTHETRMKVNKKCSEIYVKEFNKKYEELDTNTQEKIKICVGMPVICVKSHKKYEIFNNEQFEILGVDKKRVFVGDDETKIELTLSEFKKYFDLAFCITIHSSQGETITEKYTIWDWGHYYMGEKAKYVALSRATSINNIQIL